jgi:hypothetical protein
MDQYAKIDHATLVRNLSAVCKELGSIRNGLLTGLFPDPRPLSYTDIENSIPLALYKIAVACEWIEEQTELDDDEYHRSKDADLFGGSLFLTASFKGWFLGLVAETLADLEAKASENDEAREERFRFQMAHPETWPQGKGLAAPKATVEDDNPAKKKIDDFYDGKTFTLQALANLADAVGAQMEPPVVVSRVSVSRIYNGCGKVGPDIREAVARVINTKVPCTRDDLLSPKRKKK